MKMNELVTVQGSELEVAEAMKRAIAERAAIIYAQAVSPDTAASCDKLRLEISNDIRDLRKKFANAEASALQPLKEREAQIEEIVKPLEEANNAFWADIKDAKALKFKQDLKEGFYDGTLDQPNEDGEIIPFEELYEPEWGKLPKLQAAKKLLDKHKALTESNANKGKRWTVEVLFPDLDYKAMKELKGFIAKHSSAIVIEEREN